MASWGVEAASQVPWETLPLSPLFQLHFSLGLCRAAGQPLLMDQCPVALVLPGAGASPPWPPCYIHHRLWALTLCSTLRLRAGEMDVRPPTPGITSFE